MKRDGQQQMDAALEVQEIKQKDLTSKEYSKIFVKEKTIRTSSIIWFTIIIATLVIVLAYASNSYVLLLALPVVPIAPLLLNWHMKRKQKYEQEFMKQHFMKKGDPKYWGRESEDK